MNHEWRILYNLEKASTDDLLQLRREFGNCVNKKEIKEIITKRVINFNIDEEAVCCMSEKDRLQKPRLNSLVRASGFDSRFLKIIDSIYLEVYNGKNI